MKKSYDAIIDAILYYSALKKYDELSGIISLLDRYGIPQAVVEQLKGDLHYLFRFSKIAKESYKKASILYQNRGEIKKAEALLKTIVHIERRIDK